MVNFATNGSDTSAAAIFMITILMLFVLVVLSEGIEFNSLLIERLEKIDISVEDKAVHSCDVIKSSGQCRS